MISRAPSASLFPYTTLFRSGLVLDADFAFELTPRLADVLVNGVPLYFRVDFELKRPRWYWVDEKAASARRDRKSTRLNSSHQIISYAVFCLKKKKILKSTYLPYRSLSLPIGACILISTPELASSAAYDLVRDLWIGLLIYADDNKPKHPTLI